MNDSTTVVIANKILDTLRHRSQWSYSFLQDHFEQFNFDIQDEYNSVISIQNKISDSLKLNSFSYEHIDFSIDYVYGFLTHFQAFDLKFLTDGVFSYPEKDVVEAHNIVMKRRLLPFTVKDDEELGYSLPEESLPLMGLCLVSIKKITDAEIFENQSEVDLLYKKMIKINKKANDLQLENKILTDRVAELEASVATKDAILNNRATFTWS